MSVDIAPLGKSWPLVVSLCSQTSPICDQAVLGVGDTAIEAKCPSGHSRSTSPEFAADVHPTPSGATLPNHRRLENRQSPKPRGRYDVNLPSHWILLTIAPFPRSRTVMADQPEWCHLAEGRIAPRQGMKKKTQRSWRLTTYGAESTKAVAGMPSTMQSSASMPRRPRRGGGGGKKKKKKKKKNLRASFSRSRSHAESARGSLTCRT